VFLLRKTLLTKQPILKVGKALTSTKPVPFFKSNQGGQPYPRRNQLSNVNQSCPQRVTFGLLRFSALLSSAAYTLTLLEAACKFKCYELF
jgi:hypothetical protein